MKNSILTRPLLFNDHTAHESKQFRRSNKSDTSDTLYIILLRGSVHYILKLFLLCGTSLATTMLAGVLLLFWLVLLFRFEPTAADGGEAETWAQNMPTKICTKRI